MTLTTQNHNFKLIAIYFFFVKTLLIIYYAEHVGLIVSFFVI